MAKTRPLTRREHEILDRLGSLLQERGLSWAAASRLAGKSDNLGNQWSSRRSFPREAQLHRLSEELGIAMGWLLTGDEPSAETMAVTEAEKQALAALRRLSPEGQRIALAQMAALAAGLTKTHKK
jgi:transcriptional regulator with XRE-family HTH domain